MRSLDNILKSRDIILPTKIILVKAMIFPVVMYGCESWTMKKVECQRIDAFELWCWRRLLKVPWTARRSNQSILKEITPDHALEGLMLKLKLQYFGHLMQRTDSLEKTLMLGKIEGRRRKGMIEGKMVEWHQWLDGHEFEQALGAGEGQGSLACCSPWGFRVRHDRATKQQYAELRVLKMSMCYILFTRKCWPLKHKSEVHHRVITYFLILSLHSVKISAICQKWLYLSLH